MATVSYPHIAVDSSGIAWLAGPRRTFIFRCDNV
jgi:hypothetical protein